MNVFEAAPKRFERLHLHHPCPRAAGTPTGRSFCFRDFLLSLSHPPKSKLTRSINSV